MQKSPQAAGRGAGASNAHLSTSAAHHIKRETLGERKTRQRELQTDKQGYMEVQQLEMDPELQIANFLRDKRPRHALQVLNLMVKVKGGVAPSMDCITTVATASETSFT